jgi:hypothetical protein
MKRLPEGSPNRARTLVQAADEGGSQERAPKKPAVGHPADVLG